MKHDPLIDGNSGGQASSSLDEAERQKALDRLRVSFKKHKAAIQNGTSRPAKNHNRYKFAPGVNDWMPEDVILAQKDVELHPLPQKKSDPPPLADD